MLFTGACVCVWEPDSCGSEQWALDSLGLVLWVVESHHVGLGTKPSPSPTVLKVYFYFMGMNAYPACMCMHHVCAWCPRKLEEATGVPGTVVADSGDAHMGAGT